MGGTLRVAESHTARSSSASTAVSPQAGTAHGTTFEVELCVEDGATLGMPQA